MPNHLGRISQDNGHRRRSWGELQHRLKADPTRHSTIFSHDRKRGKRTLSCRNHLHQSHPLSANSRRVTPILHVAARPNLAIGPTHRSSHTISAVGGVSYRTRFSSLSQKFFVCHYPYLLNCFDRHSPRRTDGKHQIVLALARQDHPPLVFKRYRTLPNRRCRLAPIEIERP